MSEERSPRDATQRSDDERLREMREQLRRLKVADLAQGMMVDLVTVGYQKLGLTDETRELRDLGDARLAIELLGALLDTLERENHGDEVAALRSTVDGMKLGYARVAAESSPAATDVPSAETSSGPTPPDDAAPDDGAGAIDGAHDATAASAEDGTAHSAPAAKGRRGAAKRSSSSRASSSPRGSATRKGATRKKRPRSGG